MTLPLATTTVTVLRRIEAVDQDLYDLSEATGEAVVVRRLPATLGVPSGRASEVGGERSIYHASFHSDVPRQPLLPFDIVVDDNDSTQAQWELIYVREVNALGQNYLDGRLRLVSGTAQ